jgi:hypothetical protein
MPPGPSVCRYRPPRISSSTTVSDGISSASAPRAATTPAPLRRAGLSADAALNRPFPGIGGGHVAGDPTR